MICPTSFPVHAQMISDDTAVGSAGLVIAPLLAGAASGGNLRKDARLSGCLPVALSTWSCTLRP